MTEREICEVAAKLAQRYSEKGQYQGEIDLDTGFEIAAWYMNRMGLKTWDVESSECMGTDRSIRYINRLDTYAETVICEDDEFWPMSWGDWYEKAEQEWFEKTGEIRCAYCSSWMKLNQEEWDRTICGSCNRMVSEPYTDNE